MPRDTCYRCLRPANYCYCVHLPRLDTKTRVVILQHPRERDVPIGTARMANLCLPNSELHVGVSFRDSSPLRRVLEDASRDKILLFPGEGSEDISQAPPPERTTLVVVDGTWWQAKILVRENPELAKLPRYSFRPKQASEYRIRREPSEECVSTIEAIAHVLGVLEGDPDKFLPMLNPFRAMVDGQVFCAETIHGKRSRHARKPRELRPVLSSLLLAEDLVCVVGEANAWPHAKKPLCPPDELVQWAACRVATGEVFERVISPSHALSPSTQTHTWLTEAEMRGGASLERALSDFRDFVREDDVVCGLGFYGMSLFMRSGGVLPARKLDLRAEMRTLLEKRPKALSLVPEGADPPPPIAKGRAGVRLAEAARDARFLAEFARAERGAGASVG